jgi:hypothetical protein
LRPIILQAASAAQSALGEEMYARLYREGQQTAQQLELGLLIQSVLGNEFLPETG